MSRLQFGLILLGLFLLSMAVSVGLAYLGIFPQ
jgi:hypothetical protein